MNRRCRNQLEDLRGVSRLVVDATVGVTDLVEEMHRTLGGGPAVLGRPLEGPVRVITAPVYKSIRTIAQLVGSAIDVGLGPVAALLGESAPGPEQEALSAALNGVLGEYLSESRNPLAIEMSLRHQGRPLTLEKQALRTALPHIHSRLLILVHGCCMHDGQWNRMGHNPGAMLARDLGYTPLYLHYNSGLHISRNGRAFATLLDRLAAAWPTRIDEIALVGHSMGGLVSRSACHYGEVLGYEWRRHLAQLVCLGSPHHGASLERVGNWVDMLLGISRYSAPLARLGKIRSAGVTDLRYGNVLDEHWDGRDRFAHGGDLRCPLALPEGVKCYAVAGTTASTANGRLPGDGMVSVDSALGRHSRPELTLGFPKAHQHIAYGVGHMHLISRPEVYQIMKASLAS